MIPTGEMTPYHDICSHEPFSLSVVCQQTYNIAGIFHLVINPKASLWRESGPGAGLNSFPHNGFMRGRPGPQVAIPPGPLPM
jgi:hypothetical protein